VKLRKQGKDLDPDSKYTRRIILSNATPVSIPMDPKEWWDAKTDDVPLNKAETRVHQRAIGRLMYLTLGPVQIDIAYAVTKLVQLPAYPTLRHGVGIIRIFRYLHSHGTVPLTLGRNEIRRNLLQYQHS